jgi:predicted ATP-grasp superfamily ATP-dependent carboligase
VSLAKNEIPVIVTDLQNRKAFDLFQILCRKQGYRPIATADVSLPVAWILSLIYLRPVMRLRKAFFEQDLEKILKNIREKTVIFFPTEESMIEAYYENEFHRQKLVALIPPRESFEMVRNKKRFVSYCERYGFPVPKMYDPKTLLSLEELPSALIVKPVYGSGAAGIHFITDKTELKELLKSIDVDNYLFQELLENPASVEGGFFIFREGECLGYYGHRRIRTYPPEGGVTVFSKCEENEKLRKMGEELLKSLHWSGLAMVEFLYDIRSKEYKIIEVNPRVWGSIMLSECCGIPFIENYLRLSVGKEILMPQRTQKHYLRWVFPWDFLLYLKGKCTSKTFWNFDRNDTCYINISYATLWSSVTFLFFNIVNPSKIAKLMKKVFR